MRKAVFVDRDGVLNEMVYDETHGILDSPRRPEQVRMIPGAGAFLKALNERGLFVSVVTNQPGIAKGTLTFDELEAVNTRLAEQLAGEGGHWDDLRYCPHHPDGGSCAVRDYVCFCECRKPGPGMLLSSAEENGIDLNLSWMIGDGLNDIRAGKAAGCRTILVARLKLEQIERFLDLGGAEPDAVVDSLSDASPVIGIDGF